MKNILPFISLLLLLVNSIFPYVAVSNVFAEEATPSATEIISPVPSATPIIEPTATPIPSPDPSPTLTPVVLVEPTPTPTPIIEPSPSLSPTPEQTPSAQSLWQEQEDKSNKTNAKVEINKDYQDPKNDKVKVKFNKLPETSGFLTIKEIQLSSDQIAQTKSISDKAYEITSDMANGTFEYDLTLPLPPQAQNKEIKVKAAENEAKLPGASELNEQKEKLADTIVIKGLNHFTVFVITTPDPDTVQRVLINEIVPTATTEWVELYNNGTASVNLAAGTGWVIRNSAGNSESLSALGTIAPAGRAVFNTPAAWLLDTAPETVTILNELGSTIDTVTISLTAPGTAIDHYPLASESVGRRTDGTAEWKVFTAPTKSTANTTILPAAGLADVSSINPANGYPTWYKDQNGVALQLCLAGANGLADGNCVLPAAGEEPNFNPVSAVSFPTNFPGESFWYIADSDVVRNAGQTGAGRVRFRYALEAAFTTEAPTVDQQIAFLRVNMQPIDDLVPGATYTVTHPFGSFTMTADPAGSATAGTTPNHRDEDGAFTPPLTEATAASILPATNTHISKFLKQTNPLPPAGYVGDGATLSTIESGPNGNFVRVEGPNIDVNNYDGDNNPDRLTISLWTVAGKLAGSTAPVITLFGANPVNATQNTVYTDAGATALDDADGNLTGNIVVTGLPVNTTTLGAKTVTYSITDSAGNSTVATRIVNVIAAGGVDTTAPVITLVGTSPVSVVAGTPYIDAGATALDDVDGNITANIITTNPVNTAVAGTYTVIYNVSDVAGNAATSVTRTVNVIADTIAPVITVTGSNPVNLLTGAPYTDAGATATDNVDGNLTAGIVVTGLPINTTIVQDNTVTYTVADAAGNTATATRTVHVANTLPAGIVQVNAVNPTTGFPTWYKDSSGIALDLMEAADVNGISAPVEAGNPFSAAIGFGAEGFWWSADALMTTGTGGNAILVQAVEAAFAGETAVDGEQSAFARVRIRVDVPETGTYVVTYPFGQKSYNITAVGPGFEINDSVDIGCFDTGAGVTCNQAVAPNFADVLAGGVGPFLTWDTFNVNPTLTDPALINAAAGRRYVGSSTIEHAVKGSPTGNNFFRVTGPNIGGAGINQIQTNLFTVSGRLADTTAPVITRNGTSPVAVVQNAVYIDAGATAIDDFDGIVTVAVTGVPVDTAIVGAKTITYTATDRAGNTNTATRTVNVTGVDTTAPVITRLGTSPVSVTVGSVYTDAGATALDNVDGNLTAGIVIINPVNSNIIGTYTVTYNVSDAAGNAATPVTRTVNVVAAAPVADTTAPIITRLGTSPVDVTVGTAYTDAGATASDNVDGNITANIVTTNPVNTAVIGTYTVTYNVSDAAGNAATPVTRTVNVVAVVPTTASISGLVFQDINANRVKDAGEPVLPGWTLYLDANTNRVFDIGETSTVSDGAGNYQFLSLLPGAYNINEVVQTNWAIRLPGGNGYTQAVIAGDNITGKDFGNITTQTVGGQGGFATTTGTNLTSSVVAVADSVINVSSNGGTSKVTIPADTIITASTGEVFDASFLAVSDPAGALISGLGSGVALKGKLQWGIPNLGLVFSTPITLEIFVGTELNGQTLNVQRSVDGTSNWTSDGIVSPAKCTVTAGICTFQATKASYYVASQTIDVASSDSSSNSNSSGNNGGNTTQAPTCDDPTAGGAPTLLSAETTGLNQVTLTWSKAPDPVTHYVVSYGLEAGKPLYGNPNVGGKDTTSYTVKNLSGGTTYFFRVRAGNGCNGGEYSNEMSATAMGGVISGPASGFSSGVLGTATEDNSGNNESGNTGIGTNENTESNVLGQSSLLGDNKIANQSQNSNNSGLSKTTIAVIIIGILVVLGSVVYYLRKKAFLN